jgi:hypothetical protein
MRERFRDAANAMGSIPNPYDFQINHSDEEPEERTRNVERSATTTPAPTGPVFVLQQGESGPPVKRYHGTILLPAQLAAMQAYYDACSNRTIFFRDFTGVEFEVLITRFSPQRQRTLRNPRDRTLLHYWTYDIEMEVIR